jgi:hypothetical protein
MWRPGDPPYWTDPSRNAQPFVARMQWPEPAPDTDSVFQTDVLHEFVRPVVVGDLLASAGRKLLSCSPKESRVGRGAFIHWESRVLDEAGDLVALVRPTAFFYVAHPGSGRSAGEAS